MSPRDMKSTNLKTSNITVNLANPGQTTSLGLGVLQGSSSKTALQVWNISLGSVIDQHNQKASRENQIRVGDVILGMPNATKTANTSQELANQLGSAANFKTKDIKLAVARRSDIVEVNLKGAKGPLYLGAEFQHNGALSRGLTLQQVYTGKLSQAMKNNADMTVAVGDKLMSVNGETNKDKMIEKLSAWSLGSADDLNLKFKAGNRMAGNFTTLSSSMKDVLRQEHENGIVVYKKATSALSLMMTIGHEVADMTRNKMYLRVLALLFVLMLAMTSSMGVQMPQLSMPRLSDPLPFLSSPFTLRSSGSDNNVAKLVLGQLLGQPSYHEDSASNIAGVACDKTQVVLRSSLIGEDTLQTNQGTESCARGWTAQSASGAIHVEGTKQDLDLTLLSCANPSSGKSRKCIVSHQHSQSSARRDSRRNSAARRDSKKSRRRSRY